MSDITAFLLARISEDEQAQRHRVGNDWHEHQCDSTSDLAGPCDCDVPARVLAECEAKRQVVALHRHQYGDRDVPSYARGDLECQTCTTGSITGDPSGDTYPEMLSWPCKTVLAVAAPYFDHPDYDPSWTPERIR